MSTTLCLIERACAAQAVRVRQAREGESTPRSLTRPGLALLTCRSALILPEVCSVDQAASVQVKASYKLADELKAKEQKRLNVRPAAPGVLLHMLPLE